MNQSEISALKEKAQKATPGPWYLAYQTPFGAGGAVCSPRNIHAKTKDWEEVEIVQQPHMDKRNHNQAWDNGRFVAAAHPQAILALIERLEKLELALKECETRTAHIENWHRDYVTPNTFKDCQEVGMTPEAYLRETKIIARTALSFELDEVKS